MYPLPHSKNGLSSYNYFSRLELRYTLEEIEEERRGKIAFVIKSLVTSLFTASCTISLPYILELGILVMVIIL
jgi:hypothetical protein